MIWAGRPVYMLLREKQRFVEPLTLVDARTGMVLAPVTPTEAVDAARAFVESKAPLRRIDVLDQGDHYMMAAEYAANFPAYRVRFADAAGSAVYVGRETGTVFGVVTAWTRFTTWTGTVPHWLYFQWLYTRPALWTWTNLVLPGVGLLLAFTGIALGLVQLLPRRNRGEWRLSGYRGMSHWHHIGGVVFGVIVVTWTLSGLLEILGPSNEPRAGQAAGARGGPVPWGAIRVSPAAAGARLGPVLAIDITAVEGVPGYVVHRPGAAPSWVDAETGAGRGELDLMGAAAIARRAFEDGAGVRRVDRLTAYDTYYYARHGRQMHLPVFRVSMSDRNNSVLYLDTVSGQPVGFVDAETRTWRWVRDGLHTLDFPSLNNHRPLWDLVVLPLMIGGTLSALTGVWLLIRRVRRLAAV
jgi:hypothetical protein